MKQKILSFILFPDEALARAYAEDRELSGQSFEVQVEALCHSSHAPLSARLFTSLNSSTYELSVYPVNNMPSQVTWLRANGYHDFNSRQWMQETVRRQIDSVKPDVLCLPPSLFTNEFLGDVHPKPQLVIAWWDRNLDEISDCSKYDLAFLEKKDFESNAHQCQVHHLFTLDLDRSPVHETVAKVNDVIQARLHESTPGESIEAAENDMQNALPPVDALVVEALSALNGGEPGRAKELLEENKALFQDHPELHFPHALAFARLGDLFQAKNELHELLQLRPDHVFGQQFLLEIEARAPKEQEALSTVSQETGVSTQEIDELLNQAIECLQCQDLSGAKDRIVQAKGFGANVRDLFYVEALCYLQEGDKTRGASLLERELQLYPDNQEAHALLTKLGGVA